jgi:DNA-binding MurR/RpiR family transcriptional regulator
MDIGNIKASQNYITPEIMDSLVDSIINANNVYILGTRASAPLAQFLSYYMGYFIHNVKLVTFGQSDIYAQALYADKNDIVIGISFPRYSLLTVAPPAEIADYTLITKSNMNSFVDSLVAPLSLINVLIILLGLRKKNELIANFEELEKIWNQNTIYATQELDDKFLELSEK